MAKQLNILELIFWEVVRMGVIGNSNFKNSEYYNCNQSF